MREIKRARRAKAAQHEGQSSYAQKLVETAEEASVTGSLTDDCIIQILSHLSTRFCLSVSALVCRRWRRLCCSHLVLDLLPSPLNTYKPPWGSLREEEILELAKRHASTLVKVSLHGLKSLRSDQIVSLAGSLPRIKEFATNFRSLEATDLEGLANALPQHLIGLDLHADHRYNGNCEDCLTNSPGIDSFIQILQKKCTNLQKLDLDVCTHISAQCLDNFILVLPNFRILNLHSHAFGWSEVKKILRSCTSLEHLSIVSGRLIEDQISSDEEEDAGLLANRAKLRLRHRLPFISSSEHSDLGSLVPASLCSIRIYSSPHHSVPLDSTPLSRMLKDKGQQIHELHAQSLYNTSWHTISIWCANLRTLDLSHARAKTYAATGIEEVVLSGFPRLLKSLERIGLPSATDRILAELGRFCPKLREIHFEGHGSVNGMIQSGARVTDRGAVALAEGCPDLQVVSLAGCAAVSIASLRALTFHCRGLKALLLPGCTSINDNAVTTLLARCGNSLVVLDLTGCKITSSAIRDIVQHIEMHGTSLLVLALSRSLWKSTKAEHSKLMQSIPTIRVLSSSSGLPWDGFYGSDSFDNIHTRS